MKNNFTVGFTGMGADERLAENQALKLAADEAIDELINKL